MLFLQSLCHNPLAINHFECQTMAIAIFPIYDTTMNVIHPPLDCISGQNHTAVRRAGMQRQRALTTLDRYKYSIKRLQSRAAF
jgi:hypothetical protein